jgi:hypothetical protein
MEFWFINPRNNPDLFNVLCLMIRERGINRDEHVHAIALHIMETADHRAMRAAWSGEPTQYAKHVARAQREITKAIRTLGIPANQ